MSRPNITIQPDIDRPHWIERSGSFEAAHQLKGHPKCGNLHGHSYNYLVIIQSNTLTNDFGFVIDFSDISKYFKKFDHSGTVLRTSSEVFTDASAKEIGQLLKEKNPSADAKIYVFLQETGKSWSGSFHHIDVKRNLEPRTKVQTQTTRPNINATASLGE